MATQCTDDEFNSALALIAALEYEQALEAFNDLIVKYPDMSPAYYFKGCILTYIGQYEESVEVFRKHLQMRPTNGVTAMALYDSLCELGRFEEALDESIKFRDYFLQNEPSNSPTEINVLGKTVDWLKEIEDLSKRRDEVIAEAQEWFKYSKNRPKLGAPPSGED